MNSKKTPLMIQIDCDSEIAIANHYSLTTSVAEKMEYYNALNEFIDLLNFYDLKATLFVVGRDVINDRKGSILIEAITNGHEIANHTYNHPRALKHCSYAMLNREIENTENIILDKLGVRMFGFRAPNFEADSRIIRILNKKGYKYDCSILGTPYVPLIQLLKRKSAPNSTYLGRWEYMFSPSSYYFPREDAVYRVKRREEPKAIIELPISTFPYLKFPCHSSYLLALNEDLRYKILQELISWHIKKDKPLIYVFHLADLVDKRFLYGTERQYYNSKRERIKFIENFMKMAATKFTSYTTLGYVTQLSL